MSPAEKVHPEGIVQWDSGKLKQDSEARVSFPFVLFLKVSPV